MLKSQATHFVNRNQLAADWAELLELKIGRSADDIRSMGLNCTHFDCEEAIEVDFQDGSKANFLCAFFIVDQDKDSVAIFTEHCGYYVFQAAAIRVTSSKNQQWKGEYWED